MMRRLYLLLSVVTLAGCGTFADPTGWLAGADVVQPSPLLDLKNEVQPKTLWSRGVGSGTDDQRLNLQPRVVGGTVYVSDSEGEVQALAAENGKRLWSVDLDVPVSGGASASWERRIHAAARQRSTQATATETNRAELVRAPHIRTDSRPSHGETHRAYGVYQIGEV